MPFLTFLLYALTAAAAGRMAASFYPTKWPRRHDIPIIFGLLLCLVLFWPVMGLMVAIFRLFDFAGELDEEEAEELLHDLETQARLLIAVGYAESQDFTLTEIRQIFWDLLVTDSAAAE